MFQRTTNFNFQKYGETVAAIPRTDMQSPTLLSIKDKTASHFYIYDTPVYIHAVEGIAVLIISKEDDHFDSFVIHRTLMLHPNIAFSFISISNHSKIEFVLPFHTKKTKITLPLEQAYTYQKIVPSIIIREIYGCFYQVRSTNYQFPGESHSYYELTFIDSGSMHTTIENEDYTLNSYDYIIYGPNQFHTQETKNHSCSYMTILFEMDLAHPELIMNRVYHARRETYDIITRFMRSSQDLYLYDEDLMLSRLLELIIFTLQYDFHQFAPVASTPIQQRIEDERLNEILVYINENIYEALFIEDLCNKFSISRSSLQKLFKYNLNKAPKQYISMLKLEMSKRLIKEAKYTMSEIANQLGFGSIHHFSKKFKLEYGISPTEYSKTIIG